MTPLPQHEDGIVRNAFGAVNRARLIELYFASRPTPPIDARSAWQHVYKLLLWTDQTTGLAHCYESDKCQPGKRWYGRSLAFHDWLADQFGTSPGDLAKDLDWLFLKAVADLAAVIVRNAARAKETAARQREPYAGRGLPLPGEDIELVGLVRDVLGAHLLDNVPNETWQVLVQRIRQYLAMENKRKNLVGEGFEDVLAEVLRRTLANGAAKVHTRTLLQELPGFNRARRGDKPNKVDLAIVRPGNRTLVTAKWSVRADREKQFAADFGDYVSAESDGKPFEYVFVTNEFDPARLLRACDKIAGNAPMFSHVVHISTDAVKATYGATDDPTMMGVKHHIDSGRLISLEHWIGMLDSA